MWYSARQWILWMLPILLPLTVLVCGCLTFLSTIKPTQAARQKLAAIHSHFATLFVATQKLMAGGRAWRLSSCICERSEEAKRDNMEGIVMDTDYNAGAMGDAGIKAIIRLDKFPRNDGPEATFVYRVKSKACKINVYGSLIARHSKVSRRL